MRTQKPTKISLFGNFGSTNPGNEATLLAVISRLRLLFPECELCCICGFPSNVMAARGIRAVSCTVRSARIWDRQAPLLERVRLALPGLREEAWEYVRAWRTLEDGDLLIVPGTGLLTDAWGLSRWGPYGLLRWSLVARLRGCRVIFRQRRRRSRSRATRSPSPALRALARELPVLPGPSEQKGCRRPRPFHAR